MPRYCSYGEAGVYTTPTNHSRFKSRHIWFVTNMRQEHTICTTLDLIWRKQQVGQKLAFYFRSKLVVCSKPSQMCVILKKVFLSPRTCSNAAPQLVDRLLLLWIIKAPNDYNSKILSKIHMFSTSLALKRIITFKL